MSHLSCGSNEDGHIDVIMGSIYDGPRIFLNDGNGVFSEVEREPLGGTNVNSIAVGDMYALARTQPPYSWRLVSERPASPYRL